MLTDQERKNLLDRADSLKREVNSLKSSLNEINTQKESWFSKKEEIGKRIRQLIGEVKEAKTRRNELTNSVKIEKAKRQKLNETIVAKIDEIRKIKQEKDAVSGKGKEKGLNPGQVRKQIADIDRIVETEVISFDKEQALMKKRKELKRQLGQMVAAGELSGSQHGLSLEIDSLKKEGNTVHGELQTKAEQSQQRHEEVLAKSKDIDALKVQEEEAYKSFFELKQKFGEVNNKLKEKLTELNEVHKQLGQEMEEHREEKRQQRRKTLRQKEMDVQEKIRRGEKLTTDDLLVMQGAELEDR